MVHQLLRYLSCSGRESHIGFDEGSEKGAERERNAFRFHLEQKCWCGGKRTQTKSWRKRVKSWSQSWRGSQTDFCGHPAALQRHFPVSAPFPKCFPIAALTLAFYGARIPWLMVVFNWADVEEITEMNRIQVDQDLVCCMLVFFFKVMMVVNPQTCFLAQLEI